jgi:hypothetical protein
LLAAAAATACAAATAAAACRLWHLSLLLLGHMRLAGVPPGKFVFNEVCTALDAEGRRDLAEMVYEQSVAAVSSYTLGRTYLKYAFVCFICQADSS